MPLLAEEHQLSTFYKRTEQAAPSFKRIKDSFLKLIYHRSHCLLLFVHISSCFFFRLFLELPTNAQMSKWLQFCFCHSSIYCAFLLLILICRTIKETKYRFQVACYLNCLSNSSQLCMCFMFVCDGNYFTVTCKSTQCIIIEDEMNEDQYKKLSIWKKLRLFQKCNGNSQWKKKWKYFHEFQFN